MKNKYFLFTVLALGICGSSFSQDQLSRDYVPVKNELKSWDPVRGEWLAESMMAMARNQPIPDRTFPEDFTPAEMLRMVPPSNRQNIQNTVEANRTAQNGTMNGDVWNNMSGFLRVPTCKLVSGRSYGDPHLSSFDGKSFSFQTVGEFVLAKSVSGGVQIQTRQRADGEDFSLNTAVAMNVGGDRVCIYADEKPDADFSNPVRVDGRSVRISQTTYYLPHGGNIRNNGNDYVITWPTGENVTCQINNRSKFNFINVTAQIYPCIAGGYEGLLGNANGTPDDDINTRTNRYDYASANRFNTVFGGPSVSMSNEAEKEYLVYLAKEFGQAWRVTPLTTLFDYGPGQNTEYFTDYSFPRYHRTVRDLSQAQRDNARRDCENNGVRGNEIEGCIFDRAYIDLKPTTRPVHRDPTEGVVLPPIDRSKIVRNVNPPETTPRVVNPRNPVVIGSETREPVETPAPVIISRPVGEGVVSGTKRPETKSPVTAPVSGNSSTVKENKPVVSEPISKPRESKPTVSEPVSKPVVTPVYKAPVKEVAKPVKVEPAPVSAPVPVKETKPVTIQTVPAPAPVKISPVGPR